MLKYEINMLNGMVLGRISTLNGLICFIQVKKHCFLEPVQFNHTVPGTE